MSCIYVLDGHVFESELKLDDFLIGKNYLRKSLGDIVFSLSTHRLHAEEKLISASKEAARVFALGGVKKVWDDDGKTFNTKRPYLGVNKALGMFTDDIGKLLFPLFKEDSYWGVNDRSSGRFGDWAQGIYTEDELDLFVAAEGFDRNNPLKITDPREQDRFRKLIENKWEHQCLTGDAVHSILQSYFTRIKDSNGKDKLENGDYVYNKDLLRTDPSFKDTFIRRLKASEYERRDGSKIKLENLLDDAKINQVINMCIQLESNLKQKFGDNCAFYPEFLISGKINPIDGCNTLLGYIDLLVIDDLGVPHIVDYKTSVHDIDYVNPKALNRVKVNSVHYQLLTYGRLLANSDFNIDDTKYCVVPILLADFQWIDNDKYNFTGVVFGTQGPLLDITVEATQDEIKRRKLDDIIDYHYTIDLTTEEVLERVSTQMGKWIPDYKAYKLRDDEDIRKELEKSDQKPLEPDEIGKYRYKIGKHEITANSEVELVQEVKKYRNNFLPQHKKAIVKSVKEGLKDSIKQGSTDGIIFCKNDKALGVNSDKLRYELKRYANKYWEVCEGDNFAPLEELGIITLYNEGSHQYNFFRISVNNIEKDFNFGDNKHTTLGGNFQSDIFFKSDPNSMMMRATYGNIELIETMLAINQIHGMFGNKACVGNITVYDPTAGIGVEPASNYELLTCFNELEKCGGSDSKIEGGNKFTEGSIKMASKVQLSATMLRDIYLLGEDNKFEGSYKKFKGYDSCKSQLDTALQHQNKDELVEALLNIINTLSTGEGGENLSKILTEDADLAQDHVALYNNCLLALAELKGVSFRQQLKDHSNTVETVTHMFDQGLSGNYIDNPGNLSSETLNLISKLLSEGYQNIRADLVKPSQDIRKLVEALKKKKNFGWLTENTIGNQVDLYKNLYEYKDGDVFFKHLDDPSLIKEERDILEYALNRINTNRFGAAEAARLRSINAEEYYRIPLCEGDEANIVSRQGLLEAIKDKFKSWNPKTAWENAKMKAEGLFSDKKEEERLWKEENLFEMNNMFDNGERNSDYRKKVIARNKYEQNLETLLLKHEFAYASKRRIDEIFPMIKAATVHLTMQGRLAHMPFENDLGWCKDFIRNKIKNESIVDPNFREANALAGKIKEAASKLVLAFSPVQFIYQTIQGIWNDISLIIRKPDGTQAFTLSNMLKAAKIVYSDLGHVGDTPSVIEQFNRLYGVNDMDMNSYIDKIKTDLNGIFNINNFMFKFASRPDYYNRMTIFVAKMLYEGSYEAHKKDSDGNIVYNWRDDKRYKAFADDDHSNEEEYKKSRALYIATAKQFEKEHALNADGTPFKFNLNEKTPLPRCYTNLEAESMKSLSDTIYGYYSHEKKSLIHATLLGNLFMQFKTFWSGKKNQYLGTGNVKLEGKWVPYEETDASGNTVRYCYQKDSDGNLLFNEPPVLEGSENASDLFVMQWKGDWKEGIFATLWDFGRIWVKDGLSAAIDDKWNNEDLQLRNTYRSNMKQMAYDMIMWLIIGNMVAAGLADWYDDEKSEADKKDFGDALKLSAMNIAIKSVKNSFLDFNFLSSIGDPAISWTPFSIDYLGTQVSNVWKTASGDLNAWDTICKMSAVGSQFKPVFSTIKANTKDE